MAKRKKSVEARSDGLPEDWKRRVGRYKGPSADHFKRVMKTLEHYEWMSDLERQRSAFVIVEKQRLLDMGFYVEPEDGD